MVTAVVAQTKASAKCLARVLGVETHHVFGARCERTFEGLRAELVYIDATAELSPRFLSMIRATVAKTGPRGGQIRFVDSDGHAVDS